MNKFRILLPLCFILLSSSAFLFYREELGIYFYVYEAVEHNDINGVKRLFENGKSLEEEKMVYGGGFHSDPHYHSPIKISLLKNNLEITKFLISKGVYLNWHDYSVAFYNRDLDAIKELLNHITGENHEQLVRRSLIKSAKMIISKNDRTEEYQALVSILIKDYMTEKDLEWLKNILDGTEKLEPGWYSHFFLYKEDHEAIKSFFDKLPLD